MQAGHITAQARMSQNSAQHGKLGLQANHQSQSLEVQGV